MSRKMFVSTRVMFTSVCF